MERMCAHTEEKVTYGQFVRRGRGLAKSLLLMGCKPENFVVVCCGNTVDFTPCWLGCLWSGVICAPMYHNFSLADYEQMLGNLSPQVIIVIEEAHDLLKRACDNLKMTPQFVIMHSTKSKKRTDCLLLTDLWTEQAEDKNFQPFQIPENKLKEHCVISLCSSGTTGIPKGVLHTDSSLMFWVQTFLHLTPDVKSPIMTLTGGFWVTGLCFRMESLIRGYTNILLPIFTCKSFAKAVEKYRVTFTLMTVGYFGMFVKSNFSSSDITSLRMILYGGASVTDEIRDLVQIKLNFLKAIEIYGMTEMFIMHNFTKNLYKGTIGPLCVSCKGKVISIDTGEALPPNEKGELCMKTPGLFQGYHRNPKATTESIDKDGWLHTGDVAYYNEQGYFFVVNRIKELIKYQSLHVAASEVEGVIFEHPDVLEVCVVGLPHPTDWEHARAFIVRKNHSKLTEGQVVEMVQDKLPEYKWLHGGVQFLDSLPKTPSGKFKRHVLRTMASL